MRANSESNLALSVKSVRESAIFFDRLVDALKPNDLRRGRDLMPVARRARLAIPAALQDARITYAPHSRLSEKSLRQSITVYLPPRSAPKVMSRTIGPVCADFKTTVKGVTVSGKACVSCSYSFPTHVSCTVTITATIGI